MLCCWTRGLSTPNFNPHSDISYAGMAINQTTGEIWATEGPDSETFAVARFTPVP